MAFEIGIGPNNRKSVYFDATVADGVACFSVYNHMLIPAHFGSPHAEYDSLMNGVTMWDVAAQRQVEVSGPDAARLIQYLTTRDIGTSKIGQGRYVPICNHQGQLINDPVLLRLAADRFWLSIADSDIELWASAIAAERKWDVQVIEPDVSPLAIQGPLAKELVADLFGDWVKELTYFGFKQTELQGIPLVLARSGWSKQGGYELYLQDGARGVELWNIVKSKGAAFVPARRTIWSELKAGWFLMEPMGACKRTPVIRSKYLWASWSILTKQMTSSGRQPFRKSRQKARSAGVLALLSLALRSLPASILWT